MRLTRLDPEARAATTAASAKAAAGEPVRGVTARRGAPPIIAPDRPATAARAVVDPAPDPAPLGAACRGASTQVGAGPSAIRGGPLAVAARARRLPMPRVDLRRAAVRLSFSRPERARA